jgi:serine/threonine protein kinase
MATAPTANLIDTLRDCRLLETSQLDELARDLQARFPDPKELARELLRRGWLTPYQVNLLLQGRGRELLLGSYVLLERLGEGGMGQVFKARHQKMGRVVALKLVRKDRLSNPAAIRRFEHEIRTAAQLSHPNVVTSFDAAQVGDNHFFVMEYVEGVDLSQLVRDTGPLPVEQACAYIHQAALGLQYAYEKGMVHRDIKPSNLQLAIKEGQVKILDMGVARMLSEPKGDDTAPVSDPDAIVGTPDYEAPEQARQSSQVDIRADLYSLGGTFYFLLTGRPPFPGGSVSEKLLKHQLEEPEPVEKLNPEVPAKVAKVLRRLMAKRPEDRYQTPAEAAAALESFCMATARQRFLPRIGSTPLVRIIREHPYRVLALMVLLGAVLGWFALPRGPRIHPVLGYELKKHPPEAVPFNGRWFAYYPEKVYFWNDAKRRCQELGGYLACIRSREEQKFIVQLINKQNAWVGGFNDDQNKWFWVTGEPIADFYWIPTQPDNGPNVFLLLLPTFPRAVGETCWADIGRNEQPFGAGFICMWDF